MRVRTQAGYSLLELSIVLVITGILAGSSLLLGMSQLENTRRKSTEKKLDAIETALMAFRTVNGRLPCPASYTQAPSSASFGVQASDAGVCSSAPVGPSNEVVEGAVPVRTLGLSDDFTYDSWGRKFAYAVDRSMTNINVFSHHPTNETCGRITINDQAGTARSGGAVYVLLSFGPTGHGGFIQGSTRNSTGSVNANEQQNCHCNNLGAATGYDATYVQRDTIESSTAANAFDDILRYKERWQLASIDDNMKANETYYGPELLVGTTTSDYMYAYRINCDVVMRVAGPDTLPTGAVNSLRFSTDNSYVYAGTSGLPGYLRIYKRTGMALNLLSSEPDIMSLSDVNSVSKTVNGRYLALGTTLTPYIYVYKRVDDTFTRLDPPDVLPGAKVNGVAFALNGIHLIVAQQISSLKTVRIYKYLDENYQLQFTQLTQPNGTNAYGPSFSPDSVYLAVGTDLSPFLTIYRRYIDSFTKLTSVTPALASTVTNTAWSFDSKYLAVTTSAAPYIGIYKHSGDTFTKLTNPDDLPTGAAHAVAWSYGGIYLVVAHSVTPYITIYKRTNDSFAKIEDPDDLPSSNALSAIFYSP